MSKIIGVTVGTPTSPSKMEQELKPVKTVNGVAPDANGNVETGNTIYYSKETSVSQGGQKRITKSSTVTGWPDFSTDPKAGDLVISASSQLFRVSSASTTAVTLIHLADLGGGVTSWNDLEDKPFDSSVADGEVTLTFDGNVAGRDYIHIPGDASTQEQYYVKMSGDTPTKESFYGKTAYYVSNGVEGSVELTEEYMSTNCIVQEGMGFTLMLGGVAVVMVITATTTMGDMTFEPGVWFHYVVADPDYPSSVTYAGQVETIKHLDEKYIPDTIARVSEVERMINNALGVIENGTY